MFEAFFGNFRSFLRKLAPGIGHLLELLSGDSLAICLEIEVLHHVRVLLIQAMFIALEASRFSVTFCILISLLFLSLLHGLSTGWTSCFLLLCFQHNFQVLIHVHLDVLVKILKLLVTGEGLELGVSHLIMLAKPGKLRRTQIVRLELVHHDLIVWRECDLLDESVQPFYH